MWNWSSTAPIPSAARDQAGLADVRLERAISAIMDCEDSVACVDAEDKVLAYGNWLGLMQGDLEETLREGRQDHDPRAARRTGPITAPDGSTVTLKGRALMLVRNVGHLMTNPAILRRRRERGLRGADGRDDHRR